MTVSTEAIEMIKRDAHDPQLTEGQRNQALATLYLLGIEQRPDGNESGARVTVDPKDLRKLTQRRFGRNVPPDIDKNF